MISKNRRAFFNWISSVTATSSLAFIIFVPTLATQNEVVKWISVTSFLISIIFSGTTVLLHKEFDYADNTIPEDVVLYHHNILLFALVSYMVGFGALTFTVKPFLFYVFILSLIPCYWVFRTVQKKLGIIK